MVLALCASPAGIRRPQAAGTPAAASSSAARLHAARPAAAARRRPQRAAAEKEGGATQQADGEQLRVPDTPPAPAGAGAASSSSSSPQQQQTAASQLSQAESLSVEEIQRRASAMRQQKAAAEAKDGLLEGVREEIGLIKWPAPVKAVIQTLLVTAIVAGTSAGLLAINGLLSELSKVY